MSVLLCDFFITLLSPNFYNFQLSVTCQKLQKQNENLQVSYSLRQLYVYCRYVLTKSKYSCTIVILSCNANSYPTTIKLSFIFASFSIHLQQTRDKTTPTYKEQKHINTGLYYNYSDVWTVYTIYTFHVHFNLV